MERLALRDAPDFIGLLSDPELLQLMLFACPDGVLATDDEHRIVLYTGACEQIFGFPPFEVLHRDVSVLFATADDYERLRDQLSKDGRVVDLELPALRKDAAPFSAAISAAVLKDRYGSYLGTIAYVRDHTGVRNIQDELQTNNEQLEGIVAGSSTVWRGTTSSPGLLHRGSAIEAAEDACCWLRAFTPPRGGRGRVRPRPLQAGKRLLRAPCGRPGVGSAGCAF